MGKSNRNRKLAAIKNEETNVPEVGSTQEVLESMTEGATINEETSNVIPLDPFAEVDAPAEDIVDPIPEVVEKKSRKGAVGEDAIVTVLFEKNPQREGTIGHGFCALYKTGMTVKELFALGVTRSHLNWSIAHNWVSVTG